ncbi:RHS repeat protein [Hymenobacter sp. BT664]|uniref:RHS repeat protein n=1 Tax=Hymenobacter montanus TaxID=2771359 RepID=A0A927BHR3_9BACT|nr:RHS repeat domain-containing protein [Hymenobacter montanus]MBD2770374.1 RHS repeat protein [Hymenobacter montanus]
MAKNATRLVCLLAGILWLIPLLGHTQPTRGPQLPTILSPSPTVAALGKYVEVPVSTYTGVPTISIPLYEIKSRDITVPISLSYHAGGNRVGEEASWVGLGWSLQAGGVVGHTIRGRDDLLPGLNQNSTNPMPDFDYPSTYPGYTSGCSGFKAGGRPVDYCYEPPSVEADWEPDAFFYNFLSQSGKFVLDQQGTPQLLQQAKVKIDLPPAAGGAGFTIRTADGFRYEFFAAEFTSYISSGGESNGQSWYLTKIVSPAGEEVTFTYAHAATSVFQVSSLSQVVTMESAGGACAPPVGGAYTTPAVNELYLSRIDFRTGYVTFERDAQTREDLRNGQRLQFVKIYERGLAAPIKEFELVASYFVSPTEQQGTFNYSYSATEHAYAGKRLRLDQLIERSGGQAKPPHRFIYNSRPLPYKTSYSRDHWDFFNGADNRTLAPGYEGISPISNRRITFAGANREPNPATVTASILEQIQYPTGGKTRFTYEPNEYGNIRPEDERPWVTRTVTAYQRAFPTGSVETQGPATFTLQPTPGVIGGSTTLNVSVRLEIQGCNQSCRDEYTYVQLRQLDGSFSSTWSVANSGVGAFAATLNAPPGHYQLSASASIGDVYKLAFISLDIREQAYVATYKKVGGGVRIASIIDEDGTSVNPGLIRRFNYDKTVRDDLGTHLSSQGILMSRPRYHRYMVMPTGEIPCQTFQSSSSSNIQLSNTAQGALVGYSLVEEVRGQQGEGGKTVYQYYNQEDYVYEYQERIAGVPTLPYPLNGFLASRTDYRRNNGLFSKISEVADSYEAVNEVRIRGVVREPIAAITEGGLGITIRCSGCKFPLHRYYILSHFIRKTNTVERQYDTADDTRFQETSTSYFYDTGNKGHLQLSRTETQRSDGSTLVTSLTYPGDYTAVPIGALAEMRSDTKYQHSAVVESITSIYSPQETLAQAKTIGGSYTEYAQPSSTSGFLPVTQLALELAQPTANLGASAPNLPPIGRYVSKAQLRYDLITANLQQIQKALDAPTTYLWGYRNALPIAIVENAAFSQVQAALSAMGTSASDLGQVTNPTQLRTSFTQLRQRLLQARITSFTHAPLVGLTSQTAPDGRTTTYEYDLFNRLLRTRDDQGQVLSQHQYHYAGH